MKTKTTLVLIYNSFGDPLFQNLILSYIKTLSKKIDHTFLLVNFEQDNYRFSEEEIKSIQKSLKQMGIIWHPLKFHTGIPLLFWKAWDFFSVFWKLIRLKVEYGFGVIFCFANISAAIGIVLKKIFRTKMIIYSYEPHGDFMVDFGYWSKRSLKYRLLKTLETSAGVESEYVMTGTSHMVEHLKGLGAKGKIIRAPTAVDAEEFFFRKDARVSLRAELGLTHEKVFLYMGKFGGLYYDARTMALFLKRISEFVEDAFFVIITPYEQENIRSVMASILAPGSYHIPLESQSPDKLKRYLSVADIGLNNIPAAPSQKFRSPTKIAEYLLCGLPYITTTGVSEDDWYAIKYKVGIAVDSFETFEVDRHLKSLEELLTEDKNVLRERCRSVGLDYRSKKWIDEKLLEIYNHL